jgi:hypothetical protein
LRYRYGQILNICGEKTSENTFNAALEDTLTRLQDFALVDYTTAENRSLDAIQGNSVTSPALPNMMGGYSI